MNWTNIKTITKEIISIWWRMKTMNHLNNTFTIWISTIITTKINILFYQLSLHAIHVLLKYGLILLMYKSYHIGSGVSRNFWIVGNSPAKLFWEVGSNGQLKNLLGNNFWKLIPIIKVDVTEEKFVNLN